MNIDIAKTARVIRRLPRVWLREMLEVFLNRNQVLAFLIAVLGLWIILRSAGPSERDQQALNWAVSVQAFGLATLFWAVASVFRAPFIVVRQDRENGQWYGGRFVYHRPQLVAVERCVATGKPERFKIRFDDAEPCAFVDVTIEVESPFVLPRMFVAVFAELWMSPQYGQSHLKAGMRLPADRTAHLVVQMMEKTDPQTVRVYMHGWAMGDSAGNDGLENRPHKIGRTPAG